MGTVNDFHDWLERDIGRFGLHVKIAEEDETSQTVKLFTAQHEYTIRATESDRGGYLGGGASARAPLPGETWTRGRDLRDGKLTEETWRKILGDIVSFELVPIAQSGPASTVFATVEE